MWGDVRRVGGGLGRDRLADRFGGGQVFKDVDSIQLIEAALTRNERVIPILVLGAPMPPPEELPESLTRLVRRQALELSPERFEFDTNRLLKVLETTLRLGRGPAPSTGRAGAARPGPGCWPGSASPSR